MKAGVNRLFSIKYFFVVLSNFNMEILESFFGNG